MRLYENLHECLQVTLKGLRAVINQHIGIPSIQVMTNERAREALNRKGKAQFPYGWLNVQELRAWKENASGHNIARHGWFNPNSDVTNSTTTKGYLWPVALGVELHAVYDDPEQALTVAEALMILSMTNGFNFKINLSPGMTVMVRCEVPDTISIPLAETDNQSNPDGIELTLGLVLYTWVGFFKSVPRASGTIAAASDVKTTT